MSGAAYELAFDRDALKALERIARGDKSAARLLTERIRALAAEPYPASSRRLRGSGFGDSPVYRLRSGDYRALYRVNESGRRIEILDVGHRREIYR